MMEFLLLSLCLAVLGLIWHFLDRPGIKDDGRGPLKEGYVNETPTKPSASESLEESIANCQCTSELFDVLYGKIQCRGLDVNDLPDVKKILVSLDKSETSVDFDMLHILIDNLDCYLKRCEVEDEEIIEYKDIAMRLYLHMDNEIEILEDGQTDLIKFLIDLREVITVSSIDRLKLDNVLDRFTSCFELNLNNSEINLIFSTNRLINRLDRYMDNMTIHRLSGTFETLIEGINRQSGDLVKAFNVVNNKLNSNDLTRMVDDFFRDVNIHVLLDAKGEFSNLDPDRIDFIVNKEINKTLKNLGKFLKENEIDPGIKEILVSMQACLLKLCPEYNNLNTKRGLVKEILSRRIVKSVDDVLSDYEFAIYKMDSSIGWYWNKQKELTARVRLISEMVEDGVCQKKIESMIIPPIRN